LSHSGGLDFFVHVRLPRLFEMTLERYYRKNNKLYRLLSLLDSSERDAVRFFTFFAHACSRDVRFLNDRPLILVVCTALTRERFAHHWGSIFHRTACWELQLLRWRLRDQYQPAPSRLWQKVILACTKTPIVAFRRILQFMGPWIYCHALTPGQ
jgi:hypothetical protein